jgi:hypothetical protein
MLNYNAPNSESVERIYKKPGTSQLLDQVSKNICLNIVLDDPIYAFDSELYHTDEGSSILLKLNSNNVDADLIEAAVIFGESQLQTLKCSNILKSVVKITNGRTQALIRQYLHQAMYRESRDFSGRLIRYIATSCVKESAFKRLNLNTQSTLLEPVRSGFQTTTIKPSFNPLAIADNLWRGGTSGLDIAINYANLIDAELLNSFLDIYREILSVTVCPTKQKIDEVATGLATVVMVATFKEVTAIDMPENSRNNDLSESLKTEIENIIRKKEEKGK